MKRLAIVSSYNEVCGNATYAYVLQKAFSEHVEVEVLPLDLFLLQKSNPFYRSHAERHIKEIADRLKDFDYVNIQFEAGLYGTNPHDVLKRIGLLIDACRSLIVTMHRVDPPGETFTEGVLGSFGKRSIGYLFRNRRQSGYVNLYRQVVGLCRSHGRKANVWIAVHTGRERRIVRDLYDFKNVFDFPITFLLAEERQALLQSDAAAQFRRRHNIPDGVKVVGSFGFLGEYKGYETLIKTLQVLPPNYHLYVFGGQHPQSIRQDIPVDPYLGRLIKAIEEPPEPSINLLARLATALIGSFTELRTPEGNLVSRLEEILTLPRIKAMMGDALDKMTDNLTDRVRFVGALPDPEFIEAIRFSDAVVLPYLEVGQSMSGVIVLAIECGAKLFCANNLSFNEARRYYGQVYDSFDIGNHIELAQKIQLSTADYSEVRDQAYLKYNLRNNIRRHLEALGHPLE